MAGSWSIVKVLLILLFGSLWDLSLCLCCLFSGCFFFIHPLKSILFALLLPFTKTCVSIFLLCPFRVVVLGIPSLHSLDSPTRQPSSLLHQLNPWKQCQKLIFPSVSIGWTDFARVYLCPALPARISSDLQVNKTAWSTAMDVTDCRFRVKLKNCWLVLKAQMSRKRLRCLKRNRLSLSP